MLILAGAAMTYAVMEPMVKSEWVAHPEKPESASTEPEKKVVVKNLQGKNIFTANCAACHALQKTLTGPALAGVEERGPWTNRENLVKWVHNPAAFMASNAYTKELAAQYNGQLMPSFPQLSRQEIAQIFDYIKEASSQPPVSVQ